jgi:hypothetical protein
MDAEYPSSPSLSTRNGRQDDDDDFAAAFEAAAVRHAEIINIKKNQLELNNIMLDLEEMRLQIQEQEHIHSERRFNMDEERLSLDKRKFEHQKDQDLIRMELKRKERESTLKLVIALASKLLQ